MIPSLLYYANMLISYPHQGLIQKFITRSRVHPRRIIRFRSGSINSCQSPLLCFLLINFVKKKKRNFEMYICIRSCTCKNYIKPNESERI